MGKRIYAWVVSVLFFGTVVSAAGLREKDIDNGSAQMYTQLSHTDNFILIDSHDEVYKPCMTRDPTGCLDEYPSLGFVYRRISEEVIQLDKQGLFWCKTASLPKIIGWKSGEIFPHFYCSESGWEKVIEFS